MCSSAGVALFRDCLLTIGSISLTPLSSAGLWLAVTITPIHCPLSFFERRPARRPTAKTTVLRRSLRHGFGQQASTSTNGRSRGGSVWRRGRSILSKTYAFMRNYKSDITQLAGDRREKSCVLRDIPLRCHIRRPCPRASSTAERPR